MAKISASLFATDSMLLRVHREVGFDQAAITQMRTAGAVG
jgi:hypothetical protein